MVWWLGFTSLDNYFVMKFGINIHLNTLNYMLKTFLQCHVDIHEDVEDLHKFTCEFNKNLLVCKSDN